MWQTQSYAERQRIIKETGLDLMKDKIDPQVNAYLKVLNLSIPRMAINESLIFVNNLRN